jgi:hypothetical protein
MGTMSVQEEAQSAEAKTSDASSNQKGQKSFTVAEQLRIKVA